MINLNAKSYIQKTTYREDRRSSEKPNIYSKGDMINFAEEYYKVKNKNDKTKQSLKFADRIKSQIYSETLRKGCFWADSDVCINIIDGVLEVKNEV